MKPEEIEEKRLEKEANKLVSAYIYDHTNGKTVQVSCPKRLVKQVQEEATLDLLNNLRLNPNV